MLRWTASTPGGPVDLVSPARAPHAATLVGGALLFVAALIPIRLLSPTFVNAQAVPLLLGTLVVAALLGLALVALVPARAAWLVFGMLLLDIIPVIVMLSAPLPAEARSRAIWLVIPTVIAAAYPRRLLPALQWGIACLLGAGMVLAAGLPPIGTVVESALVIGTLTVCAVLVGRLARATERRRRDLLTASRTDGLTGLLNRRGLLEAFAAAVPQATADGASLGGLLLDIDHFKRLNDTMGHAHGDAVLCALADVLVESAGPTGLVGRIGGDELVAVVRGGVSSVAAAVRARLAADPALSVTVSIGIVDAEPAVYGRPGALPDLLLAADKALYEAKGAGRNRVRRGIPTLGAAEPEPPLIVPAERVVPGAAVTADSGDSLLYGLMMAFFAMIGLGAVYDPGRMSTGGLLVLYQVSLVVAAAVGVALILRRPRIGTAGMLTLCLSSEAVVMVAILLTTDMAARRFALCTLVIPALLIAAHLPRRIVLAHHLLIAVLCTVGTYRVGIDPRYWLASVLQTFATVAGPAEVIYRVRRRHDMVAAEMQRYSVTDPLTGAANRRGLEAAFAAADRRVPFTVLVVDVDHFKGVNDRLGHAAGDAALIGLVAALREAAGPGGLVARTGGDEFAVLTPDDPTAVEPTDRIRAAGPSLGVPLVLSVGQVRTPPGSDAGIWELVALADRSLTDQRRQLRSGDDTRIAPPVPDSSMPAASG